MSTAEALKGITDRGKFELLVTSILRKENSDYAAIIHTGVNAQGETVNAPLDGFCLVPRSSPPRFVLVQHTTTTGIKKLSEKWLSDSQAPKRSEEARERKDGDLIRAGRDAKTIRQDFSNATFTVVLSTNLHLHDPKFVTKVVKKAEELGVTCDIWEESRICDFLDNEPEGHWLRKQYLEIEAELLSQSLLKELCAANLKRYEEFLLPLTGAEVWAKRHADEQIERIKVDPKRTVVFIAGRSGSGKSIIAYRALKEHIRSGGYGLWIPAALIEGSLSLENAIDSVLRRLHRNLFADAGTIALQLVPGASKFLVVVDDVNRLERPTDLIRKLRGWSKPREVKESDSRGGVAPNLIVCPVWPQFLESGLSDRKDHKEPDYVESLFVGDMSLDEGAAAVRNAAASANLTVTSVDIELVASKLGCDPVLIGSYAALIPNAESSSFRDHAEHVVSQFIQASLIKVSALPYSRYLPADYTRALSVLSSFMIRNTRLYPRWTEIADWLGEGSENLNALRELIRYGELCRLTSDDGQLIFRHDRIRDAVLVESMCEVLSETDRAPEILGEPAYAELIGQAMVKQPHDQRILEVISQRNPLALFEAIKHLGSPTSSHQDAILRETKKWVDAKMSRDLIPESLLSAICWALVETDSPAVLELTEKLPPWSVVRFARLRNGCAMSGAQECSGQRGVGFAPSYTDPLRDRVLEQAKQNHREKLLVDLKGLLASSTADDSIRKGALVLSGFLGLTELQPEIGECWKLANDKTQILPEAIWAGARCGGLNPGELLGPVMEYWSGLRAQDDSSDSYRRLGSMEEELRSAISNGISEAVIKYLISQTEIHKSLDSAITFVLELSDMPDAIEFIVKKAADERRSIAGTGRISWWAEGLNNLWDHSRVWGMKLSRSALERLLSLWQGPSSDDFVKQQAFRVWLTAAEWNDIDTLRAIPSDSILFERALAKRTELGDKEVLPDLLPRISVSADRKTSFVGYWLQFAHNVWCDELNTVVEEHLESFRNNIPPDFTDGFLNPHYELSRLLRNIPVDDAEKLLEKYWDHLGYGGKFIQAALCIGTPRCLELAARSIRQCPLDSQVLRHFFQDFRFVTSRLPQEESIRRIKNLQLYLEHLESDTLWELADLCERVGIPEWGKQHLAHRLRDHRKKYYPTDEDLCEDLNQFAANVHGEWRVEYWLPDFDKRHDERARIIDIVERWLASNANLRGFEIAAECFIRRGTRADLALVDSVEITGDQEKIDLIRQGIRFAICRRSLD